MMTFTRTSAIRLYLSLFIIVWVLLLSQQIYYYAGVLLSLVCAMFGMRVIKGLLHQRMATQFALLMALFVLVWMVVGSIIFGIFDAQFYTRIFYFYFNVASAAGIAYFLIRFAKLDSEGAIRIIWLSFAIYGLLNLLALVFQPFQHASLVLLRLDEYQAQLFERQPHRFFGLAGFNGFGVSIIYPLLITLVLRSKAKNTVLGIGAVCLFTVVGFLGSRIAGILCLLVSFSLAPPKIKALMLIMSWMVVLYIMSIIEDSEMLKWAFEMLLNFMNGEGLVTDSSDILFNRMYFIPDSWLTVFFGDFHFLNSDGSYYGDTDAGFMRLMLYFGVIGCFFYYLSFIGISLLLRFEFVFLLMGIMIISEVKGDAILASPASKLYFLIIFVSLGKQIYARKSPQFSNTL